MPMTVHPGVWNAAKVKPCGYDPVIRQPTRLHGPYLVAWCLGLVLLLLALLSRVFDREDHTQGRLALAFLGMLIGISAPLLQRHAERRPNDAS